MKRFLTATALLCLVTACGGSGIRVKSTGGPAGAHNAQQQPTQMRTVKWPSLTGWKKTNEAPRDVAVIVAIEDYAFLPDVPGAVRNAADWEAYFRARGMRNIFVLTDADATSEEMMRMGKVASDAVSADGNLWYVFIGHGAPAKDGSTGVLVGMDAQQTPDSLSARGVRQNDLVAALETGRQKNTMVIVDACFSGRSKEGDALARGTQPVVPVAAAQAVGPNTVVMTAARADQFAGALPAADRPAFSYLLLGALRGWADDGDGKVTAGEAHSWVESQLRYVKGRTQTPEMVGSGRVVFTNSAVETDPDVAKIMRAGSATGVALADTEGVARIDTGAAVVVPVLAGWQPDSLNGAQAALKHTTDTLFMIRGYRATKEQSDSWIEAWHEKARSVYDRKRARVAIEYAGVRTYESEFLIPDEDGGAIDMIVWEIYREGVLYQLITWTSERDAAYPAAQKLVSSLDFRPTSTATNLYNGPLEPPVALGNPKARDEFANLPALPTGWQSSERQSDWADTMQARYTFRDQAIITVYHQFFGTEQGVVDALNKHQDELEAAGKVALKYTPDTVGAHEGWWQEEHVGEGERQVRFYRQNGQNLWYYNLWVSGGSFAARYEELKQFIADTEFE